MSRASSQQNAALIGRETELARLQAALDGLKSGGRCLLIAGEPGIGKSTLARSAASTAESRGIESFWGFTWEGGGAPAYWPWTELFQSLLDARPELNSDSLAGIVGSETLAAEPGGALQPDQARFRLYAAVRALLAEAARDEPCVLILEDLHAADTDSLNLLLYLSRQLHRLPVLLIGTFREMEARSRRAAGPLWQAARSAEVIRPQRLDQEAVARLVRDRTGRTPDHQALRALTRITEGNPLFLSELVGLLGTDPAPGAPLPETVGQIIRQQVSHIDTTSAELLPAAAVLGRSFAVVELANLVQRDVDEIQSLLAAAVEAGFLEPDGPGGYRFYHALCVDALLQQLDVRARERLHARHASYLEVEVATGRIDRTTALAHHLTRAGVGKRAAAVDAWRAAAGRARERLAFGEAAQALARALANFADGPQFPPEARCRLLLELAEAELTKGDIQSGHAHCREAFDFARTVRDPNLMAAAALTYGSAIVVARVDPFLVQALEETLAALPAEDVATRAKVTARLAAAKQPAPRPMEPVAMARRAIELARSTGDDSVLFEVLRSAVSAMMDFAPAAERVPLNREYGELARRFGNVPERFRSVLRLVMDACELADRRLLEESVRAVEQLADRIDLPHYAWRVASVKALLATLEGDFSAAMARLDEARVLAGEAEDASAGITLPLQRLMVVLEWADAPASETERFTADLESALRAFPDAELYVRPLFLAFRDPDQISAMLLNDGLVERIILGGDRFTLCLLGELSARQQNLAVVERVYRELVPFADQCATLGLMGTAWYGPVAHSLAIMAESLGDPVRARTHVEQALSICRDMRALPAAAHVHATAERLARAAGDETLAARHRREGGGLRARFALKSERRLADTDPPAQPTETTQPRSPESALALERDGEVWRVRFGSEEAVLRNSKGLEMLAQLVSQPERELHALDLANPEGPVDPGDAGPALDSRARSAYQARVRELTDAMEEAEALGDVDAVEAAKEELDFLGRELSRAVGLGGRNRPGRSAAERARVNVQRRLKDAIRRIGEQLPAAGRYLENTIKTGSYCSYRPL